MNRIRQKSFLQQRFLDPHRTEFRTNAIQRYLDHICRFREKLSILIYLCAGQPGRAPELLSIRHRNTENTYRNIFIEDGLVVLAVQYHKGFYISNNIKIIHRYLPRAIGSLLIQYLWLVLPLVERFEALHYSENRLLSTSQTALLWGPDSLNQRTWTSEHFREILQRESKIGLAGQILNIAAWRNIAIAISRRFLRTNSSLNQKTNKKDYSDNLSDDDSETSHLDLQTGYSAHIAGIVYGRQIHKAPDTLAFRRTMFRKISQDWYNFLGFPENQTTTTQQQKKRKRTPWKNKQQKNQISRRFILAQTNPDETLQYFMDNSQIQFRGIQKPVIQTIQQGISPIVAVIPTDGGKTLLFLLSVWISKDLTVVVVPLVALCTEFREHCSAIEVSCILWESQCPPDEVSIVLVTPESALTMVFCIFLVRQQTLRRLDRIVIDEYYLILNSSSIFRPDLVQLGRLQNLNVQMIFLTATLPPTLEPHFWRRLYTKPENICLLRDRTTRSNIVYRFFRSRIDLSIQGASQWLQNPIIIRLIQNRRRQTQSDRILVYASTVSQTVSLAALLDCEIFYSKQIDKESVLDRFRCTPNTLLVATSALGIDMDISDICTIIHIGWPWDLLDYTQKTGRAGRDGLSSETILIQPYIMTDPPSWIRIPETDPAEKEIIQ